MLSIILVNYLAGLGIGRWRGHRKLCRGILAVSVVFSVGFLAFFKYSNFLLMNLNALFGTSFPMLEVTKNLYRIKRDLAVFQFAVDIRIFHDWAGNQLREEDNKRPKVTFDRRGLARSFCLCPANLL